MKQPNEHNASQSASPAAPELLLELDRILLEYGQRGQFLEPMARDKAKSAITSLVTKARIDELSHINEGKKRTRLWFSDVYDTEGTTIIDRIYELKILSKERRQVMTVVDSRLEEILWLVITPYDELVRQLYDPKNELSLSVEKATQAIQQLLTEARIDELANIHRAWGKNDYDNETDECIDERIEELKAGVENE